MTIGVACNGNTNGKGIFRDKARSISAAIVNPPLLRTIRESRFRYIIIFTPNVPGASTTAAQTKAELKLAN
jgi:hypothetical protein